MTYTDPGFVTVRRKTNLNLPILLNIDQLSLSHDSHNSNPNLIGLHRRLQK